VAAATAIAGRFATPADLYRLDTDRHRVTVGLSATGAYLYRLTEPQEHP
jgi:hypothetical protein